MKQNDISDKSRGKKCMIAAAALIITAGAGALLYKSGVKVYADPEVQTGYREYSVSKGSITVGISESGTASIGRSYCSFPVSAEIEEVYVKVGSRVNKGDKLAKLNTNDIEEIKAQYEKKISDAEYELSTALSEKSAKLAEAEKTYETSISGADSADGVYSLSVTKIENDISSAEKNIAEMQKELAEYQELLKTYPSDYGKYTKYEEGYKKYSDTYDRYCDVYDGYEKTLKTYEKEMSSLNDEYNAYLESISDDQEKTSGLRANLEKAQETYNAACEKYNSAYEAYRSAQEKYMSSYNSESTNTNAEKNLETAQNDLESAQNEKEKACTKLRAAQSEYSGSISAMYEWARNTVIDGYEEKKEKQQEKIDKHKEKMDEYSDMMKEYQKKMSRYKNESDEYKNDFTKKYGNLDKEDIEKKISSLKSDIEKSEYDLESLKVNRQSSELSAKQKKDDTVFAAETALSVYERALEKIDRDIADKQEAYDTMVKEYNELTENMGDGIYLYADCSGQAAQVNISAGDTIMSNQNVITLTDSSEIYISAAVSESDISSLTVGQETSVVFTAYENVTMSGVIDTIAVEPARSSGSVSYTVTVKVDADGKYDIREGMSAEITFLQKQVTDVLYTNVNAVKFRNGVSYVLIYDENGNAAEKQIVSGFTDGRFVEISSGVSAGEKLLAEIILSENKKR